MSDQNASSQEQASGCLARIFWMLVGNFALVISAVFISIHTQSRFSAADVVFWGVVVLLLGVRYVDIRFLGGQTAFGQPAAMRVWQRYAALLMCLSAVGRGLAHGVALLTK